MPTALNAQNFNTFIRAPVAVVKVWAPWCGPCKTFAPIFDRVAAAHPAAAFGALNSDEDSGLVDSLGVRSVPTLLIYRGGRLEQTLNGPVSEGSLHNLLRLMGV